MITAKTGFHRGAMTLFLNSQPVSGLMYWSNQPESIDLEAFHQCGVDLLSFPLRLCRADAPEPDGQTLRSQFDEQKIVETLDRIVTANPDVLMLPRILMETPPDWWIRRHPGEMIVNYNRVNGQFERGGYVSPSSRAWQEFGFAVLKELIAFLEERQGEHIFGYHTGMGDCAEHSYCWGSLSDYSPAQKSAFQDWMSVHHPEYRGPVEIPAPEVRIEPHLRNAILSNPEKDRLTILFQQFSSEAMAECVIRQARTVKGVLKQLGRTKIFGAFYAYHNLPANEPESHYNTGHDAHEQVLKCPDIDFLCAPLGYSARQPGGVNTHQVLPGSLRAYHKLYYAEDDTRTHLAAEDNMFRMSDTPDDSVQVMRRNFLDVWSAGGTLWWMDLNGRGWFRSPEIRSEIRRLVQFAAAHADNRSGCAEIAVFSSDRSMWYQRFTAPTLSGLLVEQQLNEIGAAGAPYDWFRVEDLPELDLTQYKFCIFTDTVAIEPEVKRAIDVKLKHGGRTLLWMYAPGLIEAGEWKADAPAALTGISLKLSAMDSRSSMRLTNGYVTFFL